MQMDASLYLDEICDYVHLQMYDVFFNADLADELSKAEVAFQDKLRQMLHLSASQYGIEPKIDAVSQEISFGWQLAIKTFSELKECKTPRDMLRIIMNAIEVVK